IQTVGHVPASRGRTPDSGDRLPRETRSIPGGLPQWAQLAGSDAGDRMAGRDVDGLLQAGALEHVEPGHLLLGLGERAVADQHLTVTDANCDGLADRPERRTLPP